MAGLLLLSACTTRSISNSGYGGNNAFYAGELSEYDVLGIDRGGGFSEADIQKAAIQHQPITMRRGNSILLIQSGALMADPAMASAMEKYFTVSSFSGIPIKNDAGPDRAGRPAPVPYSQLFRMAAAKGGYDTVIVYWGMLESATEGAATKAISWVPIIGGIVPDETQHMRIRLLMAVIDVRTGQWETYSPEPIDDEALSNRHGRAASDQRQIMELKTKAYKAAADAIALRYVR